MFINNLYYAFIGALIIFNLSYFAYGDELGNTCTWSDWYEGPCSASCGDGWLTRTRNCICSKNDDTPNCLGSNTDMIPCHLADCCHWDEWGEWSECQNGYKSRTKMCGCVNTGDYGSGSDNGTDSSGYHQDGSGSDDSNTGGYGNGKRTTDNNDNLGYGSSGSNSGPSSNSGSHSSDTGKKSDDDSNSGSHSKNDKNDKKSDDDYSNSSSDSKSDKKSNDYDSNSGSDSKTDKKSNSSSGNDYNSGSSNSNSGSGYHSGSVSMICTGQQPIEFKPCDTSSGGGSSSNNNSVSCVWNDWGDFSECSLPCGGGVKRRTRQCICGNSKDSSYSYISNCSSSGNTSGSSSSHPNTGSGYNSDSSNSGSGYNSGSTSNSGSDYGSNSNTGSSPGSDYGSNSNTGSSPGSGYGSITSQCQCDGLAEDISPCNTLPCCSWDLSYLSDWTPCRGGFRRRFSLCNCDYNRLNYDSSSNSGSGYNSGSSSNSGSGYNSGSGSSSDYNTGSSNSGSDNSESGSSSNSGSGYNSGSSSNSGSDYNSGYSSERKFNVTLECLGYPLFLEEECIEVEIPCPPKEYQPSTDCVWQGWSEWTQCDKYCDGVQYRRQLCSCSYDSTESCSDSYDDSKCVGAPRTETKSCNMTQYGDSCSYSWGFLDEWSTCISDNNFCGKGTQWRRQQCLGQDRTVYPDDNCLYTGLVPIFHTKYCNMDQNCCEFGDLVYLNCQSLKLDHDDSSPACVTPWAERNCICNTNTTNGSGSNSGSGYGDSNDSSNSGSSSHNDSCSSSYNGAGQSYCMQCIWTSDMIGNPPITYDIQTDACLSSNDNQYQSNCYEYASNNTCVSFTVDYTSSTGVDCHGHQTKTSTECNRSAPNCWDGWTGWSPCAGTCDEAYQWRRQTCSSGLSYCRQPPTYEHRSCNLTSCCKWVFDDTIPWSNCSSLCSEGIQMRFPYSCSCSNDSKCPAPIYGYHTQPCQVTDTPCCDFEDLSEPTLCNTTTSVAWYSEKCVCKDSTSSSCDLSSCYGAPNTYTQYCECEYPVPYAPAPESPAYSPIEMDCEWREVVSDCLPECPRPYNTGDSSGSGYNSGSGSSSNSGYNSGSGSSPNSGSGYDSGSGSSPNSGSGYNSGSGSSSNSGSGYNSGSGSSPNSGSGYSSGNQGSNYNSYGCLIIVRSCYCDGLISSTDNCPSSDQLPLIETRNCSFNTECKWVNLSDWSSCTNGTQYQTRQCSCQDTSSAGSYPSPNPGHGSGSGYDSGSGSSPNSGSGYDSGSGSSPNSGSGYNSGSGSSPNSGSAGSYPSPNPGHGSGSGYDSGSGSSPNSGSGYNSGSGSSPNSGSAGSYPSPNPGHGSGSGYDSGSGSPSNSGSGSGYGPNSGSPSNSDYGSNSNSGSGYNSGSSSNNLGTFSQRCNGFSRIVQSCQSDTQHAECHSAENWRTVPWPQGDQTKSRTFTACSALTWYQLVTQSTYDDWEFLAVEIIAARLNILSGVTCDYQMLANIDSAQNLLNYCTWDDDQFRQAQYYHSIISDFNNDQYYHNNKRRVPDITDWIEEKAKDKVISSATD